MSQKRGHDVISTMIQNRFQQNIKNKTDPVNYK